MSNTPIKELLETYTAERCDFTNIKWVADASLRIVHTMPDSQVRCFLYTLTNKALQSLEQSEDSLRTLLALGAEPVGAAVTSPDDPGFTIASFEASDVPAGTMLLTQQHPVRESGEAVAWVEMETAVNVKKQQKIICPTLYDLPAGTKFYTESQPTLDFAAGMMKAAALLRERISPNDAMDEAEERLYEILEKSAQIIEEAIPKESADAEAALREVCMKVAEDVNAYIEDDFALKTWRLEEIVNSVLGEGGK
jgi:hypothetical protein